MNTIASKNTSFKHLFVAWLERHKKGYFNVVLTFCAFGGTLPGVGLTYAFFLCEQRHIQMTIVQAIVFGLSGPTVALFGFFFGTIATCLLFLTDAICFPTKSKTETP